MKFKLPKLSFLTKRKSNKTNPKNVLEENTSSETFHKIELNDLVQQLSTSLTTGLTSATASQVLVKDGKNVIKQKTKNPILRIAMYFLSGFCPLIWIAAIICILAWQPLGSIGGATPQIINLGLGVLLIIVILLQAAFTAFQDWSSGKVMKSIKNMMPSAASVIRDGREEKIPTEELVAGDLVILSYGNKVPADCRIIETKDLKFDKSMLTGESEAIEGTIECTDEKYVESKNIGFMTTLITNGSGRGIVVATGDRTMMGKIAGLTGVTGEKKTSLQRELNRFVAIIGTAASIMALIVIFVWVFWLRVQHSTYIDLSSFLVNTISVMIAFIPEGLPVCVTLSLLIVAKRMAKSRVLVKNLSVIETLSCVNVIASDKTGTLTQNKMFVASAAVGVNEISLADAGKPEYKRTIAFNQLVSACGLCNNAAFEESDVETTIRQRKAKGDATDIALLKFSAEYETFAHLHEKYATLAEIPFNSRNKWMVKVIKPKDMAIHDQIFAGPELDHVSDIVLLKGAPDYLLKKSSHILQPDGHVVPIKPQIANSIVQLQNDWCVLGQRVLIICKKMCRLQTELAQMTMTSPDISTSELENYIHKSNDFCIVGLVGIIDPPREGIADVVIKCRQAGIRVFMVTGDYALTAAAIALQIGIFTQPQYDTAETMRMKHKEKKDNYENSSLLLTGNDLDALSAEDWRLVTPYQEIVLARTTPEQKLRTVKEFQSDGFIVGVTGDGVNDAPALKSADIGIAMGSGSEVAMEASQLVLLDNNFSSILIAIENGRLVFENLRKVVLYLLPGGCFAELIPVLMSIFLGVTQNISSFQMLIISLFTDIAPSLSLMMEKPEFDLLARPPRSKKDHLVDWKFLMHAYLFLGVMIMLSSQIMFFLYMSVYTGLSPSNIFLSFDQLTNIFNETSYDRFKNDYNMSDFTTVNNLLNKHYYTGQTTTFVAIILLQIFGNLLSTRTHIKSFFQHQPWSKKSRNFYVFAAELVSIAIMLFVVFTPIFRDLFFTEPIPVQFFFMPLAFAAFIFAMDELRKLCVRRKILFFHKVAW